VNENLRRAMLCARLSEEDVAAQLQVDPKTVRRWLEGRVPYLRHRWLLANLLGAEEADLWLNSRRRSRPSELEAFYPNRQAMPRQTWLSLFGSAEREIGILDHSALFLAKEPNVLSVLSDRAHAGAQVRICLRNPNVPGPGENNARERSSAGPAESCKALDLFGGLRQAGVEIRLHRAVLYTSIYRADNQLLISQHIYGVHDEREPVLCLRSTAVGDMTTAYINAFERIWTRALLFRGQ
jgi:transcriptional regulator with XRE-family HTH domain